MTNDTYGPIAGTVLEAVNAVDGAIDDAVEAVEAAVFYTVLEAIDWQIYDAVDDAVEAVVGPIDYVR